MNCKKFHSALATISLGLLVHSASAQNPNFTPGDLLLGFRALGGIGSTDTILVNLGDTATRFRDATTNLYDIVSIGSLLDSTYGIGAGNGVAWYERTDLLFGAIGTWSNQPVSALQNGDPERTVYTTKARNTVGANQFVANSTINTPTATNLATASNQALALQQVLETQYLTSNAVIPTSAANDWTEYTLMTGTAQSTAFTAFTSGIQQAFTVGNRGVYASGLITAEGALDLYRVSYAANGETGDPNQYVSSTGTRVGEFQGSLLIDQNGNVSFNVTPVPEPGSIALLGTAGIAALASRRRQRLK